MSFRLPSAARTLSLLQISLGQFYWTRGSPRIDRPRCRSRYRRYIVRPCSLGSRRGSSAGNVTGGRELARHNFMHWPTITVQKPIEWTSEASALGLMAREHVTEYLMKT